MPVRRSSLAFLLALGVAGAAPPATAGDAKAGRALAAQWCTSCHAIEGRSRGVDTAPPFSVVANEHARSDDWLRVWLADPHPPMPNPGLSRGEIEDLVAYLDSLRGR